MNGLSEGSKTLRRVSLKITIEQDNNWLLRRLKCLERKFERNAGEHYGSCCDIFISSIILGIINWQVRLSIMNAFLLIIKTLISSFREK